MADTLLNPWHPAGLVNFDKLCLKFRIFFTEEQILVQKRTFGRWVNHFLQKVRVI